MNEQNNQKERNNIEEKDINLNNLDNSNEEIIKDNITTDKVEEITESQEEKIAESYKTAKDIKIENTLDEYLSISKNFYAGFFVRAIAYIIDLIIVACLAKILNTLTFGLLNFEYITPIFKDSLLVTITYLLYFSLMTYFLSQTLGKMIFKLKVEKNNGDKLSLLDTFYREIIGRFLSKALFLLPYLAVAFTYRKKGLHDYIADTVVVKEDFVNLRAKLNESLRNK